MCADITGSAAGASSSTHAPELISAITSYSIGRTTLLIICASHAHIQLWRLPRVVPEFPATLRAQSS